MMLKILLLRSIKTLYMRVIITVGINPCEDLKTVLHFFNIISVLLNYCLLLVFDSS